MRSTSTFNLSVLAMTFKSDPIDDGPVYYLAHAKKHGYVGRLEGEWLIDTVSVLLY